MKKFLKDIFIYGLSSSIAKFIGLLLVPIFTRLFSQEDYGSLDLITSVIAVVGVLGIMQLESGVARYYYMEKFDEGRKHLVSTALWTIVFFSSVLFSIFLFFSDGISLLVFNTTNYSLILLIACLTIPFSNIASLFTVVIQYKKQPLHYLGFQLIQIVVTVLFTLYLILYLHIGIVSVFWGQLFGFLVGCISMGIYLRDELAVVWKFKDFKRMMRYSFPLVPAVFGSLAGAYLNRFIMIGYLSLSEIALYSVALKLASVFQLAGTAFKMAWGPFFWETFEKNPDHKNVFKRIQKEFSGIAIIMVLLVALISKELIAWFTTPEYIASASLLGLLSLSVAISYIVMPVTAIGPGITKKTEYNTLTYFLSLIVNIGALLSMLPYIGLIAVPISMLLGNITLLILSWYNSERLYRVGFYKWPMFVSLIVAIVVIFVDYNYNLALWIRIILILSLLFYLIVKYSSPILNFVRNKKLTI